MMILVFFNMLQELQDSSIFGRIEQFIECENVEAQIEASRVLGNLSRSKARILRQYQNNNLLWRFVLKI